MEEQVIVLRLMTGSPEQSTAAAEREAECRVIDACRDGDMAAFQRLFEAYKDRVYSIALHYSGDDATAKDISQQVFMKLFNRIGQFRRDAEFATWLYRIVVNTCMDEHRRRRRFVPVSHTVEAREMSARESQENSYIRREIDSAVRAAIAELKPKLRMPILLKYVEGLSYDEIAEALSCSKGTVASRLNRGHKALAQRLAHLRSALVAEE
jgi:RNA polymerase sigma-70 factor (ECF subfamily)